MLSGQEEDLVQVKGLDDEVGNEAARLLNELIGGGRELSATILLGHFSSTQPVQVCSAH